MSLGPVLAALPASLPATVVRDGDRTVIAAGAADAIEPGRAEQDGLAALDRMDRGWWAGYAAYDAERTVERVEPRTPPDPALADLTFVRFAARAELRTDGGVELFGAGPERRALEDALANPIPVDVPSPSAQWTSSLDRLEYERGVRTVHELIRAGDCYQVNLTRRLTGPAIDPVRLWCATETGNPAPHAMFWRDGRGLGIVSASPERFLGVDGRRVETRPIKGTAARATRLRGSQKDRAENVMIVDLARNDLGRVCAPGSITVPELCRVEAHPGLVHLVSTVTGTLRPGVGLGTLLRATFPPASITGAPKPRVMQVIEDLEPVRRGVYCGAIGWVDVDAARADLAVAIRTFTCTASETTFGVGAGITIDSDPAAEWAETELKARRLLSLAGERRESPVAALQS
ncbi:MAG: anthranilate synthase component I family protein [Acidimicrobiia bacterium]